MGLINTTGFYRGVITGNALTQSTNGFPQEVLMLRATEVHDPDTGEFLPVDSEHDEITWYGVLIDSKDKETKNSQQLKKITGWDGASFVELMDMDMADLPLSFRVEERTYNENTSLQVQWIDEADAPPTKTVQSISKEDAMALQARYASVLAANKTPAKPVSAKSKKAEKPAAKGKKPSKPTAPKPPKASKPVGKCTADEAYNECFNLKRDDVTNDALNELWLAEVAKVNEDEAKITEEQWFQIKDTILKQVSKV